MASPADRERSRYDDRRGRYPPRTHHPAERFDRRDDRYDGRDDRRDRDRVRRDDRRDDRRGDRYYAPPRGPGSPRRAVSPRRDRSLERHRLSSPRRNRSVERRRLSPPRRDRSLERRRPSSPRRPGSPRRDRDRDGGRDRDRDRDYRKRDAPRSSNGDGEAKSDHTQQQKTDQGGLNQPSDIPQWRLNIIKRKQHKQANTTSANLSTAASPTTPEAVVTPSTPSAMAESPTVIRKSVEPALAKVSQKAVVEKTEPKPKKIKLLDDAIKGLPALPGPTAERPTVADAHSSVARSHPEGLTFSGLKSKATSEAVVSRGLFDHEEVTKKRKFQALPDYVPEENPLPEGPDEDVGTLRDIDSEEDTANNVEAQARLEARRAALTDGDTLMENAQTATENEMDIEDDPLEAYMAGLEKAPPAAPTGGLVRGQAMFVEDIEPDQHAVHDEDLLAISTVKKKRKELPDVDHSKIEYAPFRKNFYTEPSDVAAMTEEQVADLRFELDDIKVKGDKVEDMKARGQHVPRPVRKWAQMGLLQTTMNVFQELGYTTPTAIQSQAIPIAESGLDMIGIAKTGSGKTLAFGIPIIRHILDQPPLKSTDGPIGLILAPTRELVAQIVAELKPFLKASKLRIISAIGGGSISDDIANIKRGGVHVICATPGRFIDLLQANSGRVLNCRRVTYVVLDEADRMFDMGFEPQVMKILNNTRPDRQTVLFSATFPKNMSSFSKKYTNDIIEVQIGGRSVVAPGIKQIVKVITPDKQKKMRVLLNYLGQLFADDEDVRALIFVERQEQAEDMLFELYKASYICNTIHGSKDHSDRVDALNDFKSGFCPVLIATSIAARGLDVPQLKLVFNYDCPTHLEDYVHRCGRTGRAGNTGTAVTLIERPGQERQSLHLIKALKESGQTPPDELLAMAHEFTEKVKAGDEKWFDTGFGGKGLDKLELQRATDKIRAKRAFKTDDDQSDEELDLPALKKDEPALAAANGTAPGLAVAAPDENVPSYMKLLNNKIVVNKTERALPNAKPLSLIEQVKLAAAEVNSRLSKKGMIHHGQPIDNKGPDAGAFHSTIEINDFPQKARWAVTNRTNVAKILENTGVSITSKGIYYEPGKTPGENDQPKLYILVEGDTENSVHSAMSELTALLRNAMEDTGVAASSRAPTGRYTVV